MLDYAHIKYGVLIAMLAILFGGALGISFGCCEHDIKDHLRSSAEAVLADKYKGNPELAKKVTDKAWIYFKRAHFHSQTMGVISIVFSLLIASLNFRPKYQLGISILSGSGALGYGIFWLLAALLAPGMGSTGAAKESVGIIAQLSGAAFITSGAVVFALLVFRFIIQKKNS